MERDAGYWIIRSVAGIGTATVLGFLAHHKSKSVIGWVLFGLLLPLWAIIFAVIRFITGGWDELSLKQRKCPHCLNVVDTRPTKCEKCAGDLPSVLLPKREDGGIDCPKCKGKEVRLASGGYYCDDCKMVVAQSTQYGPRIEPSIEEDFIPKREPSDAVSPAQPTLSDEEIVEYEIVHLEPIKQAAPVKTSTPGVSHQEEEITDLMTPDEPTTPPVQQFHPSQHQLLVLDSQSSPKPNQEHLKSTRR